MTSIIQRKINLDFIIENGMVSFLFIHLFENQDLYFAANYSEKKKEDFNGGSNL